ncbi:MAG TPA: hypothetical protein VJP85_06145 [Candidatus Baltobacteraceae bacterium]|nr:hypothetical protein [Candidatus Baltobacteraceae bacterium]
MHSGHPYAVQMAAFYVALVPFAALFVVMIGGRFFDGLRRMRKPLPPRPAIVGLVTAFTPARRAVNSAE